MLSARAIPISNQAGSQEPVPRSATCADFMQCRGKHDATQPCAATVGHVLGEC